MKNTIFTFDFQEKQSQDSCQQTQDKKEVRFNKMTYFFEDEDQQDLEAEQEGSLQQDQDSIHSESPKKIFTQHNSLKQKNIIQEEQQSATGERSSHNKENNRDSNKKILPGVQIKEKGSSKLEYISEKKALKVTDIRNFLMSPLGDYKIRAIVKKVNSGFFNTSTKFQIFIEQNNRFLFSVLRDGFSSYLFSLSKENINSKNKNYLGVMECNVFGTSFQLYDHGFHPKQTRSLEHCRKQICSIQYEANKGPRKFQVLVSTNSQGIYALQPDRDALQDLWIQKKKQNISKLFSQPPQYDPEQGNYKLDFKGIVKKASIKNFILGGKKWKDTLIFGKIDDDTFIMEIKEPLSILQAVAVSISSIHYKLK